MGDFKDSRGEHVTAMQVSPELATVISVWCSGLVIDEINSIDNTTQPGLNVQCKDEVKRASIGDYVLKYDDGTFDVKKPLEFAREHQNWES